MARPIEPTPDIETEEKLEAFVEYMNRPPTKSEIEKGKRAKEVFKNAKFVRHH